MNLAEITRLELHHNALCYVREDIPLGEMVHEDTSTEPHKHLLFASTQTWRGTLSMLEKTAGRPGMQPERKMIIV